MKARAGGWLLPGSDRSIACSPRFWGADVTTLSGSRQILPVYRISIIQLNDIR
jgi:hypothetical protein